MTMHRPLPSAWTSKIFAAMQGHYGSRFLNMWKTNDLLPNGEDAGFVNAQNYWSEKLGGFAEHPECIAYVLDNLPETPPTLPQFVELCRRAPRKEPMMLEHHVTPEEQERNKQRLKELKEMLGVRSTT